MNTSVRYTMLLNKMFDGNLCVLSSFKLGDYRMFHFATPLSPHQKHVPAVASPVADQRGFSFCESTADRRFILRPPPF